MALRCVLVDDSPGFLEAGRRLLERQGISDVGGRLVECRGGSESRGAPTRCHAERHRPGEESGFDLARELAGRPNHSSPVILISAHLEDDFADLIRASPALGFVSKTQNEISSTLTGHYLQYEAIQAQKAVATPGGTTRSSMSPPGPTPSRCSRIRRT
jgi:hypothetical protein